MKKLQERVKEFCQKNNMQSPIEHRVLDTLSELGEVAKEILKMSDYGKRKLQFRKEIKSELGDVFYSLITVANAVNVDLEKAFNGSLAKYVER